MNKQFYGTTSLIGSNRSQFISKENYPGPGTYDLDQNKKQNQLPQWTLKPRIQHGGCFENKNQTPSPGAYNLLPQQKKKYKSTAKIPVHKQEKYTNFNEKYCVSSQLNIPSSISLKTGHSFGYRDEPIVKEHSPGPIYNINHTSQNTRNRKFKNTCRGFGYGQRNGIYDSKSELPGPGSYFSMNNSKMITKSGQNWSFSKGKRKQSSSSNSLGPGQYDPKMTANTRSFKLKGKIPEIKKEVFNIGPGNYQIPDVKNKLGTRFNQKIQKNTMVENKDPSPFTYSPQRYPDNINKQSGFTLGRKYHQSNPSLTIRQENLINKVHKYRQSQDQSNQKLTTKGGYMGIKPTQRKKNQPDDNFYKYTPNINAITSNSPNYSFSQQPLQCNINVPSQMIGPGFYSSNPSSKVETYSIGNSTRFTALKKEHAPYKENQQLYSTIGYLPPYLKKKKVVKKSSKDHNIEDKIDEEDQM